MSMYPIKNRPKSNSHGRIHPFRKKKQETSQWLKLPFLFPPWKRRTLMSSPQPWLSREPLAGDELFFDANGQRMRAVIPEGGNKLRGDYPSWTNIALQNKPSRKEISSIFRGELLLVQGVEITWITHLWRFNICSESVVILREFLSIVHCLGW